MIYPAADEEEGAAYAWGVRAPPHCSERVSEEGNSTMETIIAAFNGIEPSPRSGRDGGGGL